MKALEHINLLMSTVCLHQDDEGYIITRVSDGDKVEEKPITSKEKYKFVYPSNKNIDKKLVDLTDKRNPKVIGLAFNPITETVIGEELRSHPALRKQIKAVITIGIYYVGEMLIHLINNDSKTLNLGTDLELFLGGVNQGQSKSVKKLVDNTTIENWIDMLSANKSQEDTEVVCDFTSVKNVKEGNKTHNRCATLSFPLMEKLYSIPEDSEKIIVNGVKLRKKDLIIFKHIFKFLLKDVDENFTIKLYNDDNEIPSYKSAMLLFLKVMERIDKSGAILQDAYGTEINVFYDPKREKLTVEQVEEANRLLKELSNIPTDKQIVQYKPEQEKPVELIGNNKFNNIPTVQSNDLGNVGIQQTQTPVVQPTIPVQNPNYMQPQPQPMESQSMSQEDRLNAMFNTPVVPSTYYVSGSNTNPMTSMLNNMALQSMRPTMPMQQPMTQMMPMPTPMMQPNIPLQQGYQEQMYQPPLGQYMSPMYMNPNMPGYQQFQPMQSKPSVFGKSLYR